MVRLRFSSDGAGGSGRARPAMLRYIFRCPRKGRSIEERTSEVTNLLRAWSNGDEAASARMAEHVYPELWLMARRYMKNEAPGNSFQATALVHEVYLRLVGVTNVEWKARASSSRSRRR